MTIDKFLRMVLGLLYKLWRKTRRRKRVMIGETLQGIAEVVDGDTIKVDGITVRLAGLDAPELGQIAQSVDKEWFGPWTDGQNRPHQSDTRQKSQRYIDQEREVWSGCGVVMCEGLDIGALLVGNGHAIAAYGNQYKALEEQARREGKGIWGHAVSYDPRSWRQRHRR